MAVVITRDNGDSTFTFEVTALQAKIENTADDAARYIYQKRWTIYAAEEIIAYDDLTNAQKMDVLDKEIKYVLREMARSYYIVSAGEAARDTAKEEVDSRFIEI